MGQEGKHFYEFGPFRIDTQQRLLMRDGEVVPLTPKAVETLLALLANSGRVLEKDDLIKTVWPDTFVEEGGLARNVSMLRKALGDETEGSQYIETIPRRGYRFIAPVKESAELQPATAATPEPANTPPRKRSWRIPVSIAIAAASAVIIWWITRPPKPNLGMTSLVVLPLENLSKDEAQDYFADGMTDAILTRLAKIKALKVVSYSGHKGPREPTPEIARRLHVDAAIEGSVLSAGDRVRISARLIKTGSGEHLWAEEYEGDLRNVLAIQGEVARAIAHEIQAKATPQEQVRLTKSHPVDPEAYNAFLKGRYYASRRSGEGLLKSLDYFQQAIQQDPSYALAYSGLADAYALLGSSGYDPVFPFWLPRRLEYTPDPPLGGG